MREYLENTVGVKLQKYSTRKEVEQLYYFFLLKRQPKFVREAESVEFPKYSTSFFTDIQKDVFFDGPLLSHNGFLHSEKITKTDLPKIVNFFTTFIKHKPKGSSPFARACPGFIIDFAEKSRVNVGETSYKVLKSCC